MIIKYIIIYRQSKIRQCRGWTDNNNKKRRICTHEVSRLFLLLIPKAKNEKVLWQVFWLTPVIERLPRIRYQIISLQLSVIKNRMLFTVYCSLKKPVAKVLFKTLKWSLQQRVLFRNLTGFPFIDSMMIVSIPKSCVKVQKIIPLFYLSENKNTNIFINYLKSRQMDIQIKYIDINL